MGDLVATCMSPQSRNRHVGEQLGRGRSLEEVLGEMRMVAEGVKTASTVVELAEQHGLELPIARTIHDVVSGRLRAADAYRGLIRVVPPATSPSPADLTARARPPRPARPAGPRPARPGSVTADVSMLMPMQQVRRARAG